MALTQEQVSQLYVALFGRASEGAGNKGWIDRGLNQVDTANAMIASPAAKDYFGGELTNLEFVTFIYANTLGFTHDEKGIADWTALLDTGISRGELVVNMITEALDPKWEGSEPQNLLKNKIEVSNYMATNVENVAAEDVASTQFVSERYQEASLNVTSSASSITAAKKIINEMKDAPEPVIPGATIRLTAGFDEKVGTDGNDTFKATVIDNTNTFQSGDELDGGAGSNDKLVATLGDSSSFAIRAETKSIEEVYFTSQASNEDGNDGDNEVSPAKNTVDAELMSGVREWWNDNSRAELTIEDVRSTSSTTTIGMRNTDAGTVDYNVYYDNQYITNVGAGAGDSTLEIKMVNAYTLAKDELPLKGFETVEFTVGDQPISVNVAGLTTYAQVVSAIEAELTAQNIDSVTVSLLGDRSVVFSDDIGGYIQGQGAGNYSPILITSSGAGLVAGTVKIGSDVVDYNGLNTMSSKETAEVPSLTQTNVILDNVGRDSKSGTLEIGAMSQSSYSHSKGIEQFNIDVERSSWLEEIKSTNNTLQVLDIRNIAITKGVHTTEKSDNGDLRVDYLQDLRVVDAAKMTGALTLSDVQLTDAVVAKYLELKDTDANPANDNSVSTSYLDHDGGKFNKNFSYELGSGNDTINMTISGSNLEAAGTTTREDFVLEINGGAGNDTITTDITALTANGYLNSKDNANLKINGGEGNDTIWTKGEGDIIINAGSGNDTVYTDNTAGKAKWVVGATNTLVTDLKSQIVDMNSVAAGDQKQGFLVNGKLTVSFADFNNNTSTGIVSGYEVTVDVPTGANYAVSQLQINQAIKKAINEDSVLSKLLVAKDGPANTLVITSLVDGTKIKDSLEITVTSADVTSAVYTAAQKAQILAAYQSFSGNAGAVIANAQTANAGTVTQVDGINGIGTDGAVLATTTGATITFATAAAGTEMVAVTIGSETYTYGPAGVGDAVAVTATGVATMLLAAGFEASAAAGVVSINTTETVTTLITGAGAATTSTDAIAAITLTGTNAIHLGTDNTITLGTGDDVLVLSTDANSDETIVFTGYNLGKDTIVNFEDGNGNDVLDFTTYLGGAEATAAANAIAGAAGVLADQTAYTLVFDDKVANVVAAKITFDTLSAENVKAALNGTAAATDLDTLVFGINSNSAVDGDFILIIENKNNLGEYKIFDLSSTVADTNFDTVELVGTVDFGSTQSFVGGNIA